jgi:hypothetical protein
MLLCARDNSTFCPTATDAPPFPSISFVKYVTQALVFKAPPLQIVNVFSDSRRNKS